MYRWEVVNPYQWRPPYSEYQINITRTVNVGRVRDWLLPPSLKSEVIFTLRYRYSDTLETSEVKASPKGVESKVRKTDCTNPSLLLEERIRGKTKKWISCRGAIKLSVSIRVSPVTQGMRGAAMIMTMMTIVLIRKILLSATDSGG